MKTMKMFIAAMLLIASFTSCSKNDSVPYSVTQAPQLDAGFVTLVSGSVIAAPSSLDYSSIGGSYAGNFTVVMKGQDAIISQDYIWYTTNSSGAITTTKLDSIHVNGDIYHITSTSTFRGVSGLNQFLGSSSIPVGAHIKSVGLYAVVAVFKSSGGGYSAPYKLVQVN